MPLPTHAHWLEKLRLRPGEVGLRAFLYDLEADIMELVWAAEGQAIGVPEIHAALGESRELAYTTAMTTVARLHDKGLLSRVKNGRRYDYQAVVSRGELTHALAERMRQAASLSAPASDMFYLAGQVATADLKQLSELEKLIAARRKELK